MGNAHSNKKLSPRLQELALATFRQMDLDDSKLLEPHETMRHWKTHYAKLNTIELFRQVDADNNGKIDLNEWIEFWKDVRRGGHSEEEIEEELLNILEGKSWIGFAELSSKQSSRKAI